jgi:hypothetical protein
MWYWASGAGHVVPGMWCQCDRCGAQDVVQAVLLGGARPGVQHLVSSTWCVVLNMWCLPFGGHCEALHVCTMQHAPQAYELYTLVLLTFLETLMLCFFLYCFVMIFHISMQPAFHCIFKHPAIFHFAKVMVLLPHFPLH